MNATAAAENRATTENLNATTAIENIATTENLNATVPPENRATTPGFDTSADGSKEAASTEGFEYQKEAFGEYSLCVRPHARSTVSCVESRKPCVLYSRFKLTETLVMLLSGYDYTCDAPITPPKHSLHGKVVTRKNITCALPVEIPYYGTDFGRRDICCHCGNEEAETNLLLKASFQTVLPICKDCEKLGKVPVVHRPFGKKKIIEPRVSQNSFLIQNKCCGYSKNRFKETVLLSTQNACLN